MIIEDFWRLVEQSATQRGGRAEWLVRQLATLPVDDIIDFETHLTAQRRRVDTWLMWDAANRIMADSCSTDSFFYFQPWLVGLGRATFERVAADPDALADVPRVRSLAGRSFDDWGDDEWPEWESLNYVALRAYELATDGDLDAALEARGLARVCDPDPGDDPRGPAARAALLPRLAAMSGT